MLRCLYRISDKGRPKAKLGHATKIKCLDNFINEFGKSELYVFADNCEQSTINDIKGLGIEPYKINLGNAESWRFVVQFALDNFADDDLVYLVEDDYWHLSGSRQTLIEGATIADYISLYDHPDKYVNGINPFVNAGGETSKVLMTHSTHWKTTNSTTMTFAATVKTLKADKSVWWRCTKEKLPRDFLAFQILTKQKLLFSASWNTYFRLVYYLFIPRRKRRLITPIPAKSTHVEEKYLAPLIDWNNI